jgi:hypothetical protein
LAFAIDTFTSDFFGNKDINSSPIELNLSIVLRTVLRAGQANPARSLIAFDSITQSKQPDPFEAIGTRALTLGLIV